MTVQRQKHVFYILCTLTFISCLVFYFLSSDSLLHLPDSPLPSSASRLLASSIRHVSVVPFAKPQQSHFMGSDHFSRHHNSTLKSKKPLHLIFQFNPIPVDQGGKIMEADWIRHVVLGKLDRPVQIHVDGSRKGRDKMNDSLTVFLHRPAPINYFEGSDKLADFNDTPMSGIAINASETRYINMGAFHMGDEKYIDDLSFYTQASYIFRNYYRSEALASPYYRTLYIPLGIKSGFPSPSPSTLPPTSIRPTLCNFIGSKRSDRLDMLNMIDTSNLNCFISADHQWGSPRGIPVMEYVRILLDSQFTLCPSGNNPESLRLYEALETGSIPIYRRLPRHEEDFVWHFMKGSGIPVVSEWSEVPALLKLLTSDDEELDRLQAKIVRWWARYKEKMQDMVKEMIDASFYRAYGTWV